jgi:2-polyprenyl-3-methyl-5-hydroxy-6-metoxy-1,4-benzoquinol methylase
VTTARVGSSFAGRGRAPELARKLQAIDYERVPKEFVACSCCESGDSVVAFLGDRYGFGLRTVACSRCGLLFTNPRPTAEWFESFYRLHYRNYYESVVTPDEEYLATDWVRGRQRRNVEWLRGIGLPSRGRLLDVGSAEGTFLRLFQDAFPGWEAEGVEPSADFAEFSRSHYELKRVTTARLEDLDSWPAATMDLISINHVLEHLLDPDWFFGAAGRMLKPGGHLFIDVPDAEGESHGIGNLHIAHVYHFTMDTLGNFLEKHGFEAVSSRKGGETPQWTFQVLARKSEGKGTWDAPRVDADRIVKGFQRYAGLDGAQAAGRIWRRLRAWGARFLRRVMGRAGRPD